MPKKPQRIHAEQVHLDVALGRFRPAIEAEMRQAFDTVDQEESTKLFYGQMAYHLGWVDAQLQPTQADPGKLMRPALLLWACRLAKATTGATEAEQDRLCDVALPVAAAIELIHNFSLVHDDIVDHDHFRRHRPTLWSVWGERQGINTGDGMFSLARLTMWKSVDKGLAPSIAAKVAAIIDRTSLVLCEGQFLDMSYESQQNITSDMYLNMIKRKTAALMRASTEAGAWIGAPNDSETIAALAEFGEQLGLAFQLRDDILGIWAGSDELGKSAAGDLRRKKMSLPIIHALENASPEDKAHIQTIYQAEGPASDEDVATMLTVLESTATRRWCQDSLAARCSIAHAALVRVCETASLDPATESALALQSLVHFVELAAK